MTSYVAKLLPLLLLVSEGISMATSCECIRPPGGSVQCEDNQLAFCKVKDDRCVCTCSSVESRGGASLAAAILSEGLGKQVTAREIKQDEDYQAVFERFIATADRENNYELVDSGARVIIGVPAWVKAELARFAATLEKPEENLRPQRFDRNERVAAVDDASIAASVKAKMAADGDINPFSIDVDVNDGVVTLSGRLGSAEARSTAERLAREVAGVKRVVNYIKIGDNS